MSPSRESACPRDPGGVISSVFASRVMCVRIYLRASSVSAQPATYSGSMVTDGAVLRSPAFGLRLVQAANRVRRRPPSGMRSIAPRPISSCTRARPRLWRSVPSSCGDPAGRRADSGTHTECPLRSRPPGTFRQTSSGYSANEPISDTITARPSPRERSSVPELSPRSEIAGSE